MASARDLPSAPGQRRPRRAWRDNPWILTAAILVLIALLAGITALANRSSALAPDFLSEFVLYALTLVDLTMLLALLFVLARNVIKLVVERRRALPFARFRSKLVAVLLGMTLVPAVLVLLVGSELIRNSVDRWFNVPMDEILASAQRIASDYYQEQQRRTGEEAARVAQGLSALDLSASDVGSLGAAVAPSVNDGRLALVEVYRIARVAGAPVQVVPVIDLASPSLPGGVSRASADRLASRAAAGQAEIWSREPLEGGDELLRVAALVRRGDGPAVGVVVATSRVSGELAARARRLTTAYESYSQLRVLKAPLTGVYLSFFLMVTLLILVSATWMGLYLAKRITRPVHALAEAAREIGAGHFDHRVARETDDEFGTLVDDFNAMADELAASRAQLDESRSTLERQHAEVEARRRFTEAVLERVATGVVTVDAGGTVSTINPAAASLLGVDPAAAGRPASAVFAGPALAPIAALAMRPPDRAARTAQELTLERGGREVQLAVAVTPLPAEDGRSDGLVLVVDDITPLIRAQKVAAWREVARRLAHEIKNPLTPIQLCAQRLQRQFSSSPPAVREFVDECTSTIVGEVESLKALVDEFSQFARMPAPRRSLTDLHALLDGTLALYDGLFPDVRFDTLLAVSLPPVRLDPDQIRRVVINLVDNAVEALNQRGRIVIETRHDPDSGTVRIVIADNGPGIPAEERDKLFMPYYSTKKRGSGLGLAIVRRIVAEHGGTIEVGENLPTGTRFTIDLPCDRPDAGFRTGDV